ncbi:MAG: Fic family protein [Alphaproteobacteria bacterium]|jgi:Fic family protein|nr:Fic family protein [Alphaproteobacteria bacterium]MDP6517587.1 Fic family protein [Alphaproteobacteria bacterium]
MYIWELPDWPKFRWNHERLATTLSETRHDQGRLIGRMEALGFWSQERAVLRTLTQDVLKSSEIEGTRLDPDQVRSSIARRLGLDIGGLKPADRDVEGVVEMTLDATREFAQVLSMDRLFAWHASLFPTGHAGMANIRVAEWRDDSGGPMQVVSSPYGRQRVHFEAPPASRISDEIAAFLDWFNDGAEIDPVLKAGLAHLWFVTLHPFDDGNGRIARAIADLALARSERSRRRFYSMSAQIRIERTAYYDTLEATQKGTLDVTGWQQWFLGCLGRAIGGARETLASVLLKARFWDKLAAEPLNDRQIKVLNRVLDGFEGKLTTSKWAKLAKCSQDTAYRDILDLIARDVLKKNPAGGRSTSYDLVDV